MGFGFLGFGLGLRVGTLALSLSLDVRSHPPSLHPTHETKQNKTKKQARCSPRPGPWRRPSPASPLPSSTPRASRRRAPSKVLGAVVALGVARGRRREGLRGQEGVDMPSGEGGVAFAFKAANMWEGVE